jgi:phosphonate transport system substrate-binding protein
MIRNMLTVAALAGLIALTACGKSPASSAAANTPDVLNFSILSAEDQASMAKVWQPLLDDLQAQTGLKVKAFYASNYTALIEAMRFKQVQVGWFSASPAMEAVDRANAEVIGRVISADGTLGYNSILIVRKGSGITLADVLKCGKRYDFGIGDPKSTSGTLAPEFYLFEPRGIDPTTCFKTVRSASHQANLGAVANGVLDVATNNSEGLVFARRDPVGKMLADKVEVIWSSPPLPESGILVRRDLDPQVVAKLRDFFAHYGTAPGPDGDRQRQTMQGLSYRGFAVADDSYLDPVRAMAAANDLSDAEKSGDPARVAQAKKTLDAIKARLGSAAPTIAGSS